MNRVLFASIALLMLAIVAVGSIDIATKQAAPAAENAVAPAATSSEPASVNAAPVSAAKNPPPASPAPTEPAQAPGTYIAAQVASHASSESCYTIIEGSVYDLTSFIFEHPGGSDAILSLCGTDGTSAFMSQHGGQRRPESELASLKIGTLVQ